MLNKFYTMSQNMKGGDHMANKLKSIRESKKMSVSELARISNITRQTIHRLENEQVEIANTKTLKSLADALGVCVTEFFSD